MLLLGRSPLFLRVTIAEGKLDALDQLQDEPATGETIHIYRRVSCDGWVHVDFRRGRGRNSSAWYSSATYQLHDQQPDDPTARNREAWQAWCRTQQARMREAVHEPSKDPSPGANAG